MPQILWDAVLPTTVRICHTSYKKAYVCLLSVQTQFRNKRSGVIIEVFAAHARITVCIRIVTPTQDARVRNVGREREEVTEPVHPVDSPCLVSMSVQAVHCDDTEDV